MNSASRWSAVHERSRRYRRLVANAVHECSRRYRRLVASSAFALLTAAGSILVARRLTNSSWPLDHAEPALVAAAALAYLASLVFRARAWQRLFPQDECPPTRAVVWRRSARVPRA